MRVLVTGSSGYIGQRVVNLLKQRGHTAQPYDLPDHDVVDFEVLDEAADQCDACIHLAAHKYAGLGEDDPANVAYVNITGTENAAAIFGRNLVLASTCKAADPMTCYGASKLIAERIALNAGGRVVRLVNVLSSTGSVIDLWKQIPDDEPIPFTDCERMWMHVDVAAKLFVDALGYPPGRYAPSVGAPRPMLQIARSIYPKRQTVEIPLRRGDRPVERLLGEYEHSVPHANGVIRIHHPADLQIAKRIAA